MPGSGRNYAPEVSFLLESGLPILIYAGVEDLICNDLVSPQLCRGIRFMFHFDPPHSTCFFRGTAVQACMCAVAGCKHCCAAAPDVRLQLQQGQDLWTKALPWSGRNDFNAAGSLLWRVDDEIAGTIKTVKAKDGKGSFTHASVLGAGHMVLPIPPFYHGRC